MEIAYDLSAWIYVYKKWFKQSCSTPVRFWKHAYILSIFIGTIFWLKTHFFCIWILANIIDSFESLYCICVTLGCCADCIFSFFLADKCGDNIRITNANYLTSPGYPTSYLPSQKCVWVITAPGPHQRILINFNPHFDLEDRECK